MTSCITIYKILILTPLAEIEILFLVLGGSPVVLVFNEFSR